MDWLDYKPTPVAFSLRKCNRLSCRLWCEMRVSVRQTMRTARTMYGVIIKTCPNARSEPAVIPFNNRLPPDRLSLSAGERLDSPKRASRRASPLSRCALHPSIVRPLFVWDTSTSLSYNILHEPRSSIREEQCTNNVRGRSNVIEEFRTCEHNGRVSAHASVYTHSQLRPTTEIQADKNRYLGTKTSMGMVNEVCIMCDLSAVGWFPESHASIIRKYRDAYTHYAAASKWVRRWVCKSGECTHTQNAGVIYLRLAVWHCARNADNMCVHISDYYARAVPKPKLQRQAAAHNCGNWRIITWSRVRLLWLTGLVGRLHRNATASQCIMAPSAKMHKHTHNSYWNFRHETDDHVHMSQHTHKLTHTQRVPKD